MKKSPIIRTFKDSQEQLWNEFHNQFHDDYMEELFGNYKDKDEDEKKEIRSKANTDFVNFVLRMCSSFVEECKAKGEIWNQAQYPYKLKWIKEDLEIQNIIEKYNKLLDIIYFIDKESCLVKSDDKKLIRLNKNVWKGKRQISYFMVDKYFYERAYLKTGLKQKTIQKYLQAFCKIGILKQIKSYKLSSKAMVYSDGYYHNSKFGLKKEHWMTKEKHQKALRKFSY